MARLTVRAVWAPTSVERQDGRVEEAVIDGIRGGDVETVRGFLELVPRHER